MSVSESKQSILPAPETRGTGLYLRGPEDRFGSKACLTPWACYCSFLLSLGVQCICRQWNPIVCPESGLSVALKA